LVFTAAAVFLRTSGSFGEGNQPPEVLIYVLFAVGMGNAGVYVVLRKAFVAQALANRETSVALLAEGGIPPQLYTLTILGAALAEAFGIFGLVIVLLGGPWAVLAAPAISVVLILLQIPTRGRLEELLRRA